MSVESTLSSTGDYRNLTSWLVSAYAPTPSQFERSRALARPPLAENELWPFSAVGRVWPGRCIFWCLVSLAGHLPELRHRNRGEGRGRFASAHPAGQGWHERPRCGLGTAVSITFLATSCSCRAAGMGRSALPGKFPDPVQSVMMFPSPICRFRAVRTGSDELPHFERAESRQMQNIALQSLAPEKDGSIGC